MDMVREKMLRALHWRQAAGREISWAWFGLIKPQSPSPPVAYFLQQGHTYFNKVTPPYGPIFPTTSLLSWTHDNSGMHVDKNGHFFVFISAALSILSLFPLFSRIRGQRQHLAFHAVVV